jgi:hypothetical protein
MIKKIPYFCTRVVLLVATLALTAGLEAKPQSVMIGPTRSATAVVAQAVPSPTAAYVQRGDVAEARYQVYRERLQRLYDVLYTRMSSHTPDLLPQLEAAAPKPVPQGYQILPNLVPDSPPAQRPRAQSAWYSWPRTEELIAREMHKLDGLAAELDHLATLPVTEQKAAYEKVVAAYGPLPQAQRTIDAHIHYNRLWQRVIAYNKPDYDRQTALHDAVLERQAILDGLRTPDEATFRTALSEIKSIAGDQTRDALERELREREQTLARQIHAATEALPPPPFLRLEHPTPHLWIVHVPFYTDIEDAEFVHAFQSAIESTWHVRDGEDEFRVQLPITYVSATQLYGQQTVPSKGTPITLAAHVALFPPDGGVLTTGASTTHVTVGHCIALGPHALAPHVLAHEFGHILGFKDVYFRGYRDLGADGYQVMEVVADPEDIMGAPGSGPVLRRHFEQIIATQGPEASAPLH